MKKHKDIIRFAKDGKSIQEIADLLGYKGTSYISRVLKKNNQPVRRLECLTRGTGGVFVWYLNGKRHREDGPAVEFANGTRWWYTHGERHREDGPAREYADGTRKWYLHDELHREDGPAIEKADGTREWYLHGERHREDGPAIEWANGTREWYWRGKELEVKSQEEFGKLKPLLLIQEIQES